MDQPKSRGAGAAPQKYSVWSWIKGYTALVCLFPIYGTLWFLATFVRTLPPFVTQKLLLWHIAKTSARKQDVRIPGTPGIAAYMLRWWLIARNAFFNIYLHNVLRSDDDLALHDHPWWNFSIVLDGGYFEHTIAAGGIHHFKWFGPGMMQFRWHGAGAHRLQLATRTRQIGFTPGESRVTGDGLVVIDQDPVFGRVELPAITIFITGPVLRRWGFHHTERWVDAYEWDDFCKERGIGGNKMAEYAEQVAKPKTV